MPVTSTLLGPIAKEEVVRKAPVAKQKHEKEVHTLEKPIELLQAAQNDEEGE